MQTAKISKNLLCTCEKRQRRKQQK